MWNFAFRVALPSVLFTGFAYIMAGVLGYIPPYYTVVFAVVFIAFIVLIAFVIKEEQHD